MSNLRLPLLALAFSAFVPAANAGIPIGTTHCAGDGSGVACPCGNFSAAGSGEGCANSLGVGALLTATSTTGAVSVTADMAQTDVVVLHGSGMPNGACKFFTGTPNPGIPFGDGIRCVTGPFQVQLGLKGIAGGTAQFPDAGDLGLNKTCGGQSWMMTPLLPGSVRGYQIWYRNPAVFCSPTGYNLSNGVTLTWTL
jgi:hypothetical protein